MEEGGERLTRSGGCRDQSMTALTNCVPTQALRGGRLTKSMLEPAGDGGMKGGQRHRRNIAEFLDPMRFLPSLRCTHQPAQHPREHQLMNGPQRIPVHQTSQTDRIEQSSLAYPTPTCLGSHLKLEPGASREPHFRGQAQQMIRFEGLYSPEVHGVARCEDFGVAPATAQTGPAHEPINQSARPPKPVAVIPASLAADARNRPERLVRRPTNPGSS